MNKFLLLLIMISIQIIGLSSQNVIGSYEYKFETNMNGWTSQSITNAGYWNWTANGKADNGIYWNNRDRIQSNSLGGAIVYDGDFIVNSNTGNTGIPYKTEVQSPILDFSGESTVYLKFYQYYRNYNTNTSIEFSTNGGNVWTAIGINNNISWNVETSVRDYKIVDISSYVAGQSSVLVRFVVEGSYYYWILDDITFYDSAPIEETYPNNLGESLGILNYPFQIDDSQWAYKEKEIVIQFKEGVPEENKRALRDSIGAIKIDSCVCDKLELWSLLDSLVVGGKSLSKYGKSIGILERVKTSRASTDIDEADVNRYNSNELLINNELEISDAATVENYMNVLSPQDETALKIAIIDTGIDILHSNLSTKINHSMDSYGTNEDNDMNCYKDDMVGWNFVDNNNNPIDNHGHGTHVAGIVESYLNSNTSNLNYRIIPYKTHDAHGISNLFNVTCASYLAIKDKVSVINCSWGFYGHQSDILYNAIEAAAIDNILVVAASGNDHMDLSARPQYPACYSLDNIISVGSHSPKLDGMLSTIQNSNFSNFNSNLVDILANGEDVNSTLPNDMNGDKTGTSMSTPLISAAAMLGISNGIQGYINIKNNIFENAIQLNGDLESIVLNGNVFDSFGAQPLPMSIEMSNQNDFPKIKVFPTIVEDYIEIVLSMDLQDVFVEIIDVNGKLIIRKELTNEIERMELEDCASGIYFVKININGYIWNSKLIKM